MKDNNLTTVQLKGRLLSDGTGYFLQNAYGDRLPILTKSSLASNCGNPVTIQGYLKIGKNNEPILNVGKVSNDSIKQSVPKRTVYFKAHSDPRQATYRVQRCHDGKTFCTCPGFMFRQTCKHSLKANTWK